MPAAEPKGGLEPEEMGDVGEGHDDGDGRAHVRALLKALRHLIDLKATHALAELDGFATNLLVVVRERQPPVTMATLPLRDMRSSRVAEVGAGLSTARLIYVKACR
jgi:hypothetical protein